MGFKVEVSPEAIKDLMNIVRYIAQDNPKNAEEYGYLLLGRTDELETQPRIGRKVPEFKDPDIRELIEGSYRIVYRVKEDKQMIDVLRFWHAAQGAPEI